MKKGNVIIKVNSLSKSYNNSNIYVIQDLTISFRKSRITCILGESGVGKSTLLKIMAGLVKQDSGEIEGIDKVGLIFQEKNNFPWLTVEENIAMGVGHLADDELEKALKEVGLLNFRKYYPGQLSGGMQQRVAIARALLHKQEVLLMDEPFSSLDYKTKHEMYELVKRLKSQHNCTVIMVTHDVDEAIELADDMYIFWKKPLSRYVRYENIAHTIDGKYIKKQLMIGFEMYEKDIHI